MKVNLKIQKDSVNTLKEEILKNSNKELKKLYILCSCVKETGYDIIEECLIDLKARKFIAFGIDKKNTTKKMLENVLKYTKNVYVIDNNEEDEYNGNILVFEYLDKSYVYTFNGNITDGVLETDTTMYTVIEYDLVKDKVEYDEYINTLTVEIKNTATKLTKEYINELADLKKIFTSKQYIHTLPSISELLSTEKKEDDQNTKISSKIPKIELGNLDDFSFDIDLTDVKEKVDEESDIEDIDVSSYVEPEIKEDVFEDNVLDEVEEEPYEISDEAIDMESLIFDTETIKLDKRKVKKQLEKKEEKKQISKKIDLTKVSNIIMELQKKATKGKDVDLIKVPTYIKDIIPNFFEIMENAKVADKADGKYKEAEIKLEIIDVNTDTKYTDVSASLISKLGQTYIAFKSTNLVDITYEELDLARIIKLADNYYHIEIIPKEIEEYNLWIKLCTNNFKGSTRRYGLM